MILAVVLFMESHFFQLSNEMVGGAAVEVPVGVDAVGAIGCPRNLLILGRFFILLVAVPAVPCGVAWLATDLAARDVRSSSWAASAATLVAVVVGPTAAAVAAAWRMVAIAACWLALGALRPTIAR